MFQSSRSQSLPLVISLLATLLLVGTAAAEHHEAKSQEHANTDGYTADFLGDFDSTSKKLLSLAEAFPADEYSWRPANGIRSVSESLVHVATTNFFLAKTLGVDMPADIGRDAEKTITAKSDVIALLEKSQDHVRKALEIAGGDLDKERDIFGGTRSTRGVFMLMAGHTHEHLGQAIAYARSVGVVPPWSAGGS